MEIGGSSQEMHTLHALVVFDALAQQRINLEVQRQRAEDQRAMIFQRVKGAGLVFGGVLGLLALTWCGLRWAGRPQPAAANGAQAEPPRHSPAFVPVVIVALVVLAALAASWWLLGPRGPPLP